MKTTEQINQIKTLKSLIADMVAEHKATKQNEGWSSSYRQQRLPLFVAYTAYYMLRHGIENQDEYIDSVLENMRPENRDRTYYLCFFGFDSHVNRHGWNSCYGNLKEAVNACIECLNKYIEANKDGKE